MLGEIGAARSMDFSHHKKYAWFSYVPILQLGLAFPKSISIPEKDRNPYFSWLAIVAGILCMGLGLAFHLKGWQYLKQLDSNSQTMQETIELYELETATAKLVAGLVVPTRSLVRAEALPKKLSLTYLIEGDVTELSTDFATFKLVENCGNSVFGAIIDAGGEVISIYIKSNQTEIGRIITNKSNCQ
ncbi:MAG: hypothetical protein WBG95_06465 [Sulfitobacter sp.]